jgi:hypothetical protein
LKNASKKDDDMNKQTKNFCKNFKNPDEVRPFKAHGHLEILNLEGQTAWGKGTFEPGWKWSNDVKPIAGTESCQSEHTGYCISGRMTIRMDSGEEFTIQEGDAFHLPAGHDAWVSGNEPCVLLDVAGSQTYAKKAA